MPITACARETGNQIILEPIQSIEDFYGIVPNLTNNPFISKTLKLILFENDIINSLIAIVCLLAVALDTYLNWSATLGCDNNFALIHTNE